MQNNSLKHLIIGLDTGQDQRNQRHFFTLFIFPRKPAPPGGPDTDWGSVRNRFSLASDHQCVAHGRGDTPMTSLVPLTTDNNPQIWASLASHLITPALDSSHECLQSWGDGDWGGQLVKYSLVHFHWSTIGFSCFHVFLLTIKLPTLIFTGYLSKPRQFFRFFRS